MLTEAKASKFKNDNYPHISDESFWDVVSIDTVTSSKQKDEIGKYGLWLIKLKTNGQLNVDNRETISSAIKIFKNNI